MKGKMKIAFAWLVVALAFGGGVTAEAAIRQYYATMTITSGTATTSASIPLAGSEIKAIYAAVPTMDAGDITTLSLQLNYNGTDVTPAGWTDVSVGATEDNGIKSSGAISVFTDGSTGADGAVWFEVTAASAQSAPRVFEVWFMVRH